jgi:hypothetical protein
LTFVLRTIEFVPSHIGMCTSTIVLLTGPGPGARAETLSNSPLDWHANLTRVRGAQGFASSVNLVVVVDYLKEFLKIKVIHNQLPVNVKLPTAAVGPHLAI